MRFKQQVLFSVFPALLATATPLCARSMNATMWPWDAPLAALWQRPADLAQRDLYLGPWGESHAPDPRAEYTFVRPKRGGVNPGMVVRDPEGREWHVKQAPPGDRGDEGPSEVVLSRVLSAVGYHQPPVYFLPSFTLRDESGTRVEPGGRFRLHLDSLKARGEWSWQENPFVGMRPYQGLLVILMMFNSTDLKNSNNTLYEVEGSHGPEQRYVVRDLGNALGRTGRIGMKRNNVALFTRTGFITGVEDGFVVFDFHGLRQELVRDRITPDDVGWAIALLTPIAERQWRDAFRAGGYAPDVADRFIRTLRSRIAEGQQIAGDDWPGA